MSETITIRRPDDWHVHLRDGAMLEAVAPFTARQFARAIVMPNLAEPVTTAARAREYRERIRTAAGPDFKPLMTAYLTDETDPDDLEVGHRDGTWVAAKLYPAGATTNSASGVTDVNRIRSALERMEKIGMVLCVHGEVTDPQVDVFDREAVFIERVLTGIVRDFPGLKIVFEHITTSDAANFVAASGPQVAATVTPHHLVLNRNALFEGGLRPHVYCLPVIKREGHRLAVRKAATSGNPKFFLGSDSAPHAVEAKESACGCAGIFNSPFALESYLQVFEEEDALAVFEGFASEYGARFYGLDLNPGTITLERVEASVPEKIAGLVPFHAGQRLNWRMRTAEASA